MNLKPRGNRIAAAAALCALAALSGPAAMAQSRSRPPSLPTPPPARQPDPPSRPTPSTPSLPEMSSGRLPGISSSGTARTGESSYDRYRRTEESAATQRSRNRRNSGGFYPYVFDPLLYSIYGYGYPYPVPGPTFPTPVPSGSPSPVALFDSPYYFCDDLGAPYVGGVSVLLDVRKPKRVYLPTPVFEKGALDSWRDLGADDYLADRNAADRAAAQDGYRVTEAREAGADLDVALDEIVASWRKADVEPLAALLRKDTPVAVFLNGKYVYALNSGDLLQLTRDAFAGKQNLRFELDHVHRRANGIYTATGRHLFTDSHGRDRAVYFSYVLAKVRDSLVITQMGAVAENQ